MGLIEFKEGDYVIYPMHGVGKVIEISNKIVLGKRKKYYQISLLNNKMKLMLPIDRSQEMGLREIISKQKVTSVIKVLKQDINDQEEDWKIRYQNNLNKIKTGSLNKIAEVCRDLYRRAENRDLSIMERKLYETAYSMIIYELSIVKDSSIENISNFISEILSKKKSHSV